MDAKTIDLERFGDRLFGVVGKKTCEEVLAERRLLVEMEAAISEQGKLGACVPTMMTIHVYKHPSDGFAEVEVHVPHPIAGLPMIRKLERQFAIAHKVVAMFHVFCFHHALGKDIAAKGARALPDGVLICHEATDQSAVCRFAPTTWNNGSCVNGCASIESWFTVDRSMINPSETGFDMWDLLPAECFGAMPGSQMNKRSKVGVA